VGWIDGRREEACVSLSLSIMHLCSTCICLFSSWNGKMNDGMNEKKWKEVRVVQVRWNSTGWGIFTVHGKDVVRKPFLRNAQEEDGAGCAREEETEECVRRFRGPPR
jgi:transketolase N-terminal domain/subunit